VKIFGLFGKTATRHVRNASAQVLQPDVQALSTSKKIDEIECEMSAEFSTSLPSHHTESSLSTQATDLRQTIEEASILFGSGQTAAARELLSVAITQPAPKPDEKIAWRMLLELHEAEGNQAAFEQHALAYAERFETSPPPWQCTETMTANAAADKLPALSFRGKLSGSSEPMLDHLFQMGCRHRRFRLEFINVSEVDLAGCRALLDTLSAWQAQACEVSLKHVDTLNEKIRGLIQPGRRDDDETGWRLLMELLWLIQDTTAYEAACIDYSITYEVSPPSPPSSQIPLQDASTARSDQAFIMPATIEMPVSGLLAEINAHAQCHERIVLDCRDLRRVDFNAASPLLTDLNRLASIKPVELRHTSFLVSVLLRLVGGDGKLKIIHRKT
jgi:ABC-type transporter Mla MlaB component